MPPRKVEFAPNTSVPAYRDNLLIESCGPIPNPAAIAQRLTNRPPVPRLDPQTPAFIRTHDLMSLRGLYVPQQTALDLGTTIDLLLRQGYVSRNPTRSETWRRVYSGVACGLDPPPLATHVSGVSGTGKTITILRSLMNYPQTVVHSKFPGMASAAVQLLWLKVDAPSSGKALDFALSLFAATRAALGDLGIETVSAKTNKASVLFDAWLRFVQSRFLGLLVVDEVSNFFKLAPKDVRRSKKAEDRPPLTIVEDEIIKFLITFNNTAGFPLVLSGTPDGLAALATRLGTLQRLGTGGFCDFRPSRPGDLFFEKLLLPELASYQWVDSPIACTPELCSLILRRTAGVPRIYVTLWYLAQRRVLEQGRQQMKLSDLDEIMNTDLAPLLPAVDALNSNDPRKLGMYEDLLPRDAEFWAKLYARP